MLRATPLSLGRWPRSVRDHWPGGRAAGGWRAGACRAGSRRAGSRSGWRAAGSVRLPRSGWRAAGGFATRFSPELSTNPGRPTASGPYIRRRIRSSQLILRRSACWSTAGRLGYGGARRAAGAAGWRAPVPQHAFLRRFRRIRNSGRHPAPEIRRAICSDGLPLAPAGKSSGETRGGTGGVRRAKRRPLAHPPEPGYPCYVSVLGELAWMAPREEPPTV
jgi:hypothetical protein